jgi:formate hydrogenlyase subunit 3/multisubunit Na+/H+ antiporter MnhD subunit
MKKSVNSPNKTYKPNKLTAKQRAFAAVTSTILFAFSAYALYAQKISFSYTKIGWNKKTHHIVYSGNELILLVISCTLVAAYFLLKLIDHYDERQNEWKYELFGNLCLCIGMALMFISYIVGHKY